MGNYFRQVQRNIRSVWIQKIFQFFKYQFGGIRHGAVIKGYIRVEQMNRRIGGTRGFLAESIDKSINRQAIKPQGVEITFGGPDNIERVEFISLGKTRIPVDHVSHVRPRNRLDVPDHHDIGESSNIAYLDAARNNTGIGPNHVRLYQSVQCEENRDCRNDFYHKGLQFLKCNDKMVSTMIVAQENEMVQKNVR